jgi:hypothetical protein
MPAKFDPVPNTGSQIERAVLALLKDAYADEGADYSYVFSNCASLRKVPLIDVLAHKSTETVPHTGNESFAVRIEWIWDGSVEVGQDNPDDDWKAINRFVGIGMAALSQTEGNAGDPNTLPNTVAAEITRLGRQLAVDDPDNHADMANFTCDYVEFKGSQRAEAVNGTLYLKEIRHFEIRACPANVD